MTTAPPPAVAAGGRPLLFDGADVRVVDARAFGSAACVVTFDSFSDAGGLDREGFGEAFLREEGIDAVHVLNRRNLWWQHEEMRPALAAVRAAVAGHGRVVAYGSSMGAYAALRLAGEAGAGVALALSPQFSILHAVAPFEHRWNAVSRRLRPVWEGRLPLPALREAYVVYDPYDLDARHAELFAEAGLAFTPVRLPGVGHHTTTYLAQVGLLKALVRAVVAGPLEATPFVREARRRRRRSPQFLLALAERAHAPELKRALVERALRIDPGDPTALVRLGDLLRMEGRPREALALLARALEIAGDAAPFVIGHARALAEAGEPDEARERLRALAERTGDPDHAWAAAELDRAGAAGTRRGTRLVCQQDPGLRPPAGAPSIEVAADESGPVLCGPHVVLRPGRYVVSFGVRVRSASRPLRDGLPAISVTASLSAGRRLARRVLSTRALRQAGGRIELEFVVPEKAACEFWLHARGRAALTIDPARPYRRV